MATVKRVVTKVARKGARTAPDAPGAHLYACGLGGAWVQVREALRAPTARKTTATITGKVRQEVMDQSLGLYQERYVRLPQEITVYQFTGGKSLGVVRSRSLAWGVGANHVPRIGEVVEVPKGFAGKLRAGLAKERALLNGAV